MSNGPANSKATDGDRGDLWSRLCLGGDSPIGDGVLAGERLVSLPSFQRPLDLVMGMSGLGSFPYREVGTELG
jgi:hypothetical protein